MTKLDHKEIGKWYSLRSDGDAMTITRLCNALESAMKVIEEMRWIASVPQDSIFIAPEIWGKVLEYANKSIAAFDEATNGKL